MKQTRDPERTRNRILESALREIHRKGFKAASLSGILAETGLTRGALYHHFANKRAVGFAALEWVKEHVTETWLRPLEGCPDPITRIREVMIALGSRLQKEDIELGCPLNNLALEMSPIDEEFRIRVVEIYDLWRKGVAAALRLGQSNGTVNPAVDPLSTATFFVAALSGCRGLAKAARSSDLLLSCADNLSRYLETLRT